MSAFGLSPKALAAIRGVFTRHPEVTRVRVFGSRAKGTQREGSDIDLCVDGNELPADFVLKLQVELEALMFPYRFDVVVYATLENAALREHIDRVGVPLFDVPG